MLSNLEATTTLSDLIERAEPERRRFERVRAYIRGDHDPLYTNSSRVRREYRKLAEQSVLNLCPVIVHTATDRLYVDGYRSADSTLNSEAWAIWQHNRMDAKQNIIHQSVVAYGVAYATVLPGSPFPVISPKSALRMSAFFDDEEDDFPEYAIERLGKSRYRLYDAEYIYEFKKSDNGDFKLTKVEEHGVGVCPVVVFTNGFDAAQAVVGDVERVIPQQNNLNQINFSISIAQEFASFRQKYALGYEIPRDEDGEPLQSKDQIEASLAKMWLFEDENMKVGEFGQTDIRGSLENRSAIIKNIAILTAIPAHYLLGDLVNISADALAAVESSQTRRTLEKQHTLGEAYELLLALAADLQGIESTETANAGVVWRDTSTRSMSQQVDALVKLKALGVPQKVLWGMVPGVTQGDVLYWESVALEESVRTDFQTVQDAESIAQGQELRRLIDSGVSAEDAAEQLGLAA